MMFRLNSLRARFVVAILLWTALGIAAIWFSSTRLFTIHVAKQYHDELRVHVQELDALTKLDALGQPYLSRPLSDPRFSVPRAGFYWQITRKGFAPVRSPSLTRGKLDDSVARLPTVSHRLESGPTGEAITYGLVRRSADGNDLHFVIATDQRILDEITRQFEQELTVWLAILAILLLASGGIFIWFGLRPLEQLTHAIAGLRKGETTNIEGHYPSEIAPLVNNLNAYVSSNETLVASARTQAANLAHALRTPLAVMTDEAERLKLQDPSSAAANTFLEQCELMTQQIEYQLARARSSTGQAGLGGSCNLQEVIKPILNAMRRLHPDKSFEFDCQAGHRTRIGLDEVACREMLGCILDNAGKWATAGVRCHLYKSNQDMILDVADDGPGMTVEQGLKAFDIGSRFDETKSGSGLGLAVARDIARAVNGDIAIISHGSVHQGLLTRITLPSYA